MGFFWPPSAPLPDFIALQTLVSNNATAINVLQSSKANTTDVTNALALKANLTDIPVIGKYTVATLPSASSNQAKYAFVTDLGGGADMVISDGTNWKHIREGIPASKVIASSLMITPLVSAPITLLTGYINTSVLMTISTTNLYAGYGLSVIVPNGVLGALGSFGVKLAGGNTVSQIGNSWADYVYDGTNLIKIRSSGLI